MSDPTIPGGKKLCPSCTTYVGVNDSVCGNCGYNFDTGENVGGAGDTAGTPTSPLTVYSESSGPSGVPGQNAGKVIAIAVTVFILAVGGVIAYVVIGAVNDATDSIEDVTNDFDIDVPGVPDFEFTPGDIGAGTNPATDYRSCVGLITKYLKLVLANDGRPAELPTVLQEAVTEMGVSSPEFQAFTEIYTANAGTAVTKNTKAALRDAKRDTKDACRDEWG